MGTSKATIEQHKRNSGKYACQDGASTGIAAAAQNVLRFAEEDTIHLMETWRWQPLRPKSTSLRRRHRSYVLIRSLLRIQG